MNWTRHHTWFCRNAVTIHVVITLPSLGAQYPASGRRHFGARARSLGVPALPAMLLSRAGLASYLPGEPSIPGR